MKIEHHVSQMRNLLKSTPVKVNSNKNIIFCFSGVMGSGKSTFIKALYDKFGGIIISGDQIRDYIDEQGLKREMYYKEIYLPLFKQLLDEGNGIIYHDSSIDRVFEELQSTIAGYKYKLITTAFILGREEIEKRIKSRGREVYQMLENLNKAYSDQEKFLAQYGSEVDYSIYEHTDYNELIINLGQKISGIH